MVRDLQDVRAQVVAEPQQVALGLGLDVAGEQHDVAPGLDAQHQRAVVRVRARAGEAPRRRQDGPSHLAGGAPFTQRRGRDGHAGCGGLLVDLIGLVGRVLERTDLHHPDLAAVEHAGQPVDVVGVQVAEQHDRHPVDPEPVEAAVDGGRVRPSIDHHGRPVTGGQHDRVALTDVADDEEPAGGRPGRPGHRQTARRDRDAGQRRDQPAPEASVKHGEPDHRREGE